MKAKLLMKFYCLIVLLFLSSGILAQNPAVSPDDEASRPTWEKYNAKYNNPIYIVDGKTIKDSVSKRVVDGIDRYAIVKISVVSGKSPKSRNFVYLTTITSKITAYQQKFGNFSPDYKKTIAGVHKEDGLWSYFLNGEILQGARTAIAETLDNIPADKIKSVDFKFKDPSNAGLTMVFIRTKD